MNVLVVGGSSGLGLEIVKELVGAGNKVIVTGRTDPKVDSVEFKPLDLAVNNLPEAVEKFVQDLPHIDTLVYSAGAYPFGLVTDFTPAQIEASLSVAGRGLIYFARALLIKQGELGQVITITSMAQFKPVKKEVIYDFVKAGAGHFSNGLAEDERVGKVLVAAPAGLKDEGEEGDLLSRKWVAQQILEESKSDYEFKLIKILKDPARVEIAETR